MDSYINFFSLNVGMSNTLAGLPAIIKAEDLDIIFLQEVRLIKEQIEHLLKGFKAAVNVDHSQLSKPGTAIVWKETLPVTDVCPLVLCRAQMATLVVVIRSMNEIYSLAKKYSDLCIWTFKQIGFWEEIITVY